MVAVFKVKVSICTTLESNSIKSSPTGYVFKSSLHEISAVKPKKRGIKQFLIIIIFGKCILTHQFISYKIDEDPYFID
jgi:hypothetical protein